MDPDHADLAPRGPGTPARVTWPRWLPAVRLVWIVLSVLGGAGTLFLHGLGLASLLALPALAVALDLALQRVRFERVRVPDAAIATGLFLALIFPPSASLILAGSATAAAIALRHALRVRGRPWLNPAASGALLGSLAFGLTPAWWVAVGPWGTYLMVALGGVILFRTLPAWRLPAVFLTAYALTTIALHIPTGNLLAPSVLLLEAADPVMVFFGLYMVAEPRTSPADPTGQTAYALGAATLAALLPLALPTVGAILALLGANMGVAIARAASRPAPASPVPSRKRRRRAAPPDPATVRWPIGYRAGLASFVLLILLAAAALTAPAPLPTGFGHTMSSSSGSGSPVPGPNNRPQATCAVDNTTIPSNVRSQLHSALGPSVLLSYDANTGLTIFYDPVNHVTVTETDLFEDYGYAEFNGDDYAVAGCHP